MSNKLEITYIKLKEIKPYKDNPKNHPEEQIDKIIKSIEKFGFKIPILINEKKEIIAGHGRYFAAKKLNLKEIPCIYIEGLNKSEMNTFRIADNKVAESEWDEIRLSKIFKIIREGDKELLDITGFSDNEIKQIMKGYDYDDLSKEIKDLELGQLETIEWTAKFKNEKEFEDVRKIIFLIKQGAGIGCFKSDYSNGRALKILCEECKDEEDCNAEALKALSKKYEKKIKNGNKNKRFSKN